MGVPRPPPPSALPTPVKVPLSLCGADTDEGGGGEDDSLLDSADREKQRRNDAKAVLAHLVDSDSGEDEGGPVGGGVPVSSALREVASRASLTIASSSEEERPAAAVKVEAPPPAAAKAPTAPAAPPAGAAAAEAPLVNDPTAVTPTAAATAADDGVDEDDGSTSDESDADTRATAHAAALEREAAAWTAGLVAEVGVHAGRPAAAAPTAGAAAAATDPPTAADAAAVAGGGSVAPPPPGARAAGAAAATAAPGSYVPHEERRVLAAYVRQALATATERARSEVAAAAAPAPAPAAADSPDCAAAEQGAPPPAHHAGGDAAAATGDDAGDGDVLAARCHAAAVAGAAVLGGLTGLLQSVRHGRVGAPATVASRVAAIFDAGPPATVGLLPAASPAAAVLSATVRDVRRRRRRRRAAAVASAATVPVSSVEQAAADVAWRRRVAVDTARGGLLSGRPAWKALRRRTEAGTRRALAVGGGCGVDWSREPPAEGAAAAPPAASAFLFPEYGDVWNAVAPLPSLAAARAASCANTGGGGGGGGADADADDEDAWAANGGVRTPGAVRRNVELMARVRRQRRRLSAYARATEPTAEPFDLDAAGDDDASDGGTPHWVLPRRDDGPAADGTPGHREHEAMRSVVALLLYHGGFEDASSAALDVLVDATGALFERVATSLAAARSAPSSLPTPPTRQPPASRSPSTLLVHPLQGAAAPPRAVRGAHVPVRLRHTPPPPHPHTALSDVVSVTQRVLASAGTRGGLPEMATYRAAAAARVDTTLRESAVRLGLVATRVSENRVRSSGGAAAVAAAAAAKAAAAAAAGSDGPGANTAGGAPGEAPVSSAGAAGSAAAAAAGASPSGGGAADGDGVAAATADADDFPPEALLFGRFGPSTIVDILGLTRLGLGAVAVPPHMATWALAPFALQAPPPPPPPPPEAVAAKAEPDAVVGADGAAATAAPGDQAPDAGAAVGGAADAIGAAMAADLDGMDGLDFAAVANGLSIVDGSGGAVGGGGGAEAGGGGGGGATAGSMLDMVAMDEEARAGAAGVLDELDVPLTALASVVAPAVAGGGGGAAGAAAALPLDAAALLAAADGGGEEDKAGGGGATAGAEPSAVDYGLAWADAGGGDPDGGQSVDHITALF